MIHSLRTRVSSKNIIDGRPINRSDVWQRTLSSCMDFDFANLREHTEKYHLASDQTFLFLGFIIRVQRFSSEENKQK